MRLFLAAIATVSLVRANDLMPAPQQNELLQKYCAICHSDKVRNGGLSLEHFDAAKADPTIAAMIVSKLGAGAIGAAGLERPDKPTQEALRTAMVAESVGSTQWNVTSGPRGLTASLIHEERSTEKANTDGKDLYRLTLTCRADTHEGEFQLAWSPGVPKPQELVASADGEAPLKYKIQGTEKMGNGQAGDSGPGAVDLAGMRIPSETLAINNLFAEGTMTISFAGLNPEARRALSACFN